MRRTFDELWIIDLGGDNLGPRKTPNVFAIQTPVAIAIGARYGKPNLETPATVHYTSLVEGNREEKLARLADINEFADSPWESNKLPLHRGSTLPPLFATDAGVEGWRRFRVRQQTASGR